MEEKNITKVDIASCWIKMPKERVQFFFELLEDLMLDYAIYDDIGMAQYGYNIVLPDSFPKKKSE